MIHKYFKDLYQDSMHRAYADAYRHISAGADGKSSFLDCGASDGRNMDFMAKRCQLPQTHFTGIEWDATNANIGRETGFNIRQSDLNKGIPFQSESFSCIYALSVLEHLLNPCSFIKECHRTLRPGGQLVILTPNISTYFTAALILAGKMPSSGPHPDSNALLKSEEPITVSNYTAQSNVEGDTPVHRHLVVFSYRVLEKYLQMIGFKEVTGRGFGLYPFPKFTQPLLERIDPYHCHQMVFVATK